MTKYLFYTFIIFLLASCSANKEVIYFQDLNAPEGVEINVGQSNYSVIIQPDDELAIIISSTNTQVVEDFNLPLIQSPTTSTPTKVGKATSAVQAYQTYIVDSEGKVTIPTLGTVKLGGMTREEAVMYLETVLKDYGIKEPIVTLQIVNFKVSVLGEVTMPGSYQFTSQRVSILDAIAMAQDMTIFAKKDEVILIRDESGEKQYFKYDLTKSDIFNSPNFYLQQNDVVIVTPNKEKRRDASSGEHKRFLTSTIISVVGSVISIAAIVYRR